MKTWILACAFFVVIIFTAPVVATALGYLGLAVLCLLGAYFVSISLEEV